MADADMRKLIIAVSMAQENSSFLSDNIDLMTPPRSMHATLVGFAHPRQEDVGPESLTFFRHDQKASRLIPGMLHLVQTTQSNLIVDLRSWRSEP